MNLTLPGYCPTRCSRWIEFGSTSPCSVSCGNGTKKSNFLCIDRSGNSYGAECNCRNHSIMCYNGPNCPCRGNPDDTPTTDVPCQQKVVIEYSFIFQFTVSFVLCLLSHDSDHSSCNWHIFFLCLVNSTPQIPGICHFDRVGDQFYC